MSTVLTAAPAAPPLSAPAFAAIAAAVHRHAGIVIAEDQAYLLPARLGPVLRRHALSGLDALGARLRDGTAPASLLGETAEALTVNESFFFRDGRPFDHLRRTLPALAAARPPGRALRVWSAACSTGQEAYSIAMVAEELRAALGGRAVEILGTDLSHEVVARAQSGLYTQFEVQRGLPVAKLVQHFRQEDGRWRIAAPLRAMATFRVANLLEDQRRLGPFDVIFCRNVLIYFDPPTKARVLGMLADCLAPDGVLHLGGAETVFGLSDRLAALPGERGVFGLPRGRGAGPGAG